MTAGQRNCYMAIGECLERYSIDDVVYAIREHGRERNTCPVCGGLTLSGHCPNRHEAAPANFSVWEEFASNLDADDRRAALEILVGAVINRVPAVEFETAISDLRRWHHREYSRKVSGSPYQE